MVWLSPVTQQLVQLVQRRRQLLLRVALTAAGQMAPLVLKALLAQTAAAVLRAPKVLQEPMAHRAPLMRSLLLVAFHATVGLVGPYCEAL